jgi:PAS domain S-box-containing protein
MKRFHDSPIRTKLVLLILAVSVVIVVLVGGVRLVWDMKEDRLALSQELASLASLLGNRSSAALAFDDARLGQENLAALRDVPHMVLACLYRDDGVMLAEYRRNGAAAPCPPAGEIANMGTRFTDDRLHVAAAVQQNQQPLGWIYLCSDLSLIESRLRDQMLFSGLALLAAVLMTGLLAGWLQRLITRPLEAVTAAARDIEHNGNYQRRAPVANHDEVGELARSFNAMLDALQARTGELVTVRADREALLTRYRSLFDHANDVILLADADSGQILDINPAASARYGYSREEMLDMGIRDFSAPEALGEIPKIIEQVRTEGEAVFERLHRAKDGHIIPVEVSARLIELDGHPVFLSIVRDLSDRKRTEEAIRNIAAGVSAETGEDFFRQLVLQLSKLFDTKYAFIGLLDEHDPMLINTLAVSANGAIAGNISYRLEDTPCANVVGQSTCAHPDGVRQEFPKDILLQQMGVESYIGTPLFDSAGKPLGLIVLLDDKPLQRIEWTGEILQIFAARAGAELERVRAERDLLVKEEALRRSQKMEAVGQLAGGVAHDFNNQLGIIIGYLDFLAARLAGDDKPRQWVETATQATLRCMDLTRQLLAFSRRQAKEKRIADLNTELSKMDTLIARSVTPAITVRTYPGEGLWPVAIDPGEFQDAILNLVLNARDAMPEGGQLIIETSNKLVDTHHASLDPELAPGDYVQVMVSDTGCGMDKATVERVFEPFFTTKPEGKGTGLGLAMVYGFAKSFGGEIKAYSEPGVGTTFRLYLPRAADASGPARLPAPAPDALPRGNETILIVDDEPDLVRLAEQYLTDLGYRTLTANNPQEAFDLLARQNDIDLLFSDVVMPGDTNGYVLAERAAKRNPGLKVLLTSGFTANTIAVNGQARFSANLLHKPYRRDDLARRVRAVLDQGVTS